MKIKKQTKTILLITIVGVLLLIGFGILKLKKSTTTGKKTVDIIVTNGTVLTMNPKKEIIKKGTVIIKNGNIIDIGKKETLTKKYTSKKNIDAQGGVILPGLINAHTHAPMALFRGLADDLPLMECFL